jgi:exodeoxyribonuclease VII large subunit
LETAHPAVYVRGEISNFLLHRSGHMYFSLKDKDASLKAAYFRGANFRIKFAPENGMDVIAFGRLSVYEPRGEYQVIVEHLEPAGLGALTAAIEALKKKLQAEGLFDPGRKRELPDFPHSIALVTSPEGAAIKDFLKVTRSRFPGQHITIFPVLVQGEAAPAQVAEAIADANAMGGFDVMVVCRGGGSIEDLMGFNDESVARAIAASGIPVVTGIGHERDVTIADLVADVRAATPSQAAEMVSPSRPEITSRLIEIRGRMERHLQGALEDMGQELDGAVEGLEHSMGDILDDLKAGLKELGHKLAAASPVAALGRQKQLLEQLASRIGTAGIRKMAEAKQKLSAVAGKLDVLSPLGVLNRGYAIAFGLPGKSVLKDASLVGAGQEIEVKLFKGSIRAVTRSTEP